MTYSLLGRSLTISFQNYLVKFKLAYPTSTLNAWNMLSMQHVIYNYELSRCCTIIPEKSVNGFCPQCVCAQYQACPPISRPPPSATKC